MKSVFLSLALLSAPAFAADYACPRHLPCGSYAGPGVAYNADGSVAYKFEETVSIAASSETQAKMLMTVKMEGQDEVEVINVDFTFAEDGSFTAKREGEFYAAGACARNACTYGMIPFKNRAGEVRNTGILEFTDGKLLRNMFVRLNGETLLQSTTMKKRGSSQ